MPLIPVVERRISPNIENPNAPMNIGTAGVVGNAIEQAGKQSMADINQLSTIMARQKAEKDQLDSTNIINTFDKKLIDYKAQAEQNTGEQAYGTVERAKTDIDKIVQEQLKDVRPDLIPKLQSHLDARVNQNLEHLSVFELGQQKVAKKNVELSTVDTAMKKIVTVSDSPINVQESIADATTLLTSLNVDKHDIEIYTAKMAFTAAQTALNNNDLLAAKTHYQNNKIELDAAGLGDDVLHKIKTADKSFLLQDVMQTVEDKKQTLPEGQFGIDKQYEEVKKQTKDPDIRRLAYDELERQERLTKQATQDTYNKYSSQVNLYAGKYFDNKQEVPISKIVTLDAYRQLPDDKKDEVLKNIRANNWQIYSHNRTIGVEERRQRSDEHKVTIDEWNKNFNQWNNDPDSLSQLSATDFSALENNMSHTDYKMLTTKRQKLVTPQNLHHAKIEAEILTTSFNKAGITDPEEIKKLSMSASRFVAAEQERQKRMLTPKETQDTIIQGLQHVMVNEKTTLFGVKVGNSQTDKLRMRVKNKAAIIGDNNKTNDSTKDKYGFIVGETRTVNGKDYQYRGSDQWQAL